MQELKDMIQSNYDAMKTTVERQDTEIAKLGEPMEATRLELVDIHKEMDELQVKLQRQALPSAAGLPPVGKGTEEDQLKSKAFYNWIRKGRSGMEATEQKALVEDGTGQYLVEPEMDMVIERTLPILNIMRPLCAVRTIKKDRLKLKSLSEVVGGWGKLETGHDIEESTMTPGAPTYQYVEDWYGLAKIGEDELDDSDFNLRALLSESFARAIAEAEESAFITGSGHDSEEPEGLTVNATILAATRSVTTSNTVVFEDYMKLVYDCPKQYRKNGKFLVKSSTELALRELRSATDATYKGPFLWQPSLVAGVPNTFLGYPIYTQDDFTAYAGAVAVVAAFGDFKQGYRILDRKGITLQRLVELYSEAGLVGFKIRKRTGGSAIMPSKKAICLLSDKA